MRTVPSWVLEALMRSVANTQRGVALNRLFAQVTSTNAVRGMIESIYQ
jgi:hypothetical protein